MKELILHEAKSFVLRNIANKLTELELKNSSTECKSGQSYYFIVFFKSFLPTGPHCSKYNIHNPLPLEDIIVFLEQVIVAV